MSQVEQRLTAQDEIPARIQERLDRDCQCVNLNVRAPKRPAPHDPIARDIVGAGRPFPVAKFLDQKEREDQTRRETRRSFAPTFGMLVQVLKKKRLKDEGTLDAQTRRENLEELLLSIQVWRSRAPDRTLTAFWTMCPC